ncbi:hypothetical protein BSLG_006601 [Batrachochytrium salamandrivorans]|nr:hypothetical protein BSLG_006601 [Batrachochytrium salamandrivorans]
MDTPKTPRRHRRVRQEPLRVRMLSLPLDWLMLLGEWWANIDHEQLLSKSSFLVALLLNVLYLLIKMYRDGVLDDPDELRALSKSSQQHLEELSLEPNSKWLFFQWWGQGVSYQLLPRYAGDNQWMLRSRNAQICQVDIAQPTPKEGNGSLLQWINDQQILSGQLLHEFTESLVDHRSFLKSNPKMSVGDDSAATFDTEADAYAHED